MAEDNRHLDEIYRHAINLDFMAKNVSSIVRERMKIYLYASVVIIRNISGTPIILNDLIKAGNEVVKTISKANETELSILRKTSDTTWIPSEVIPIF